MTYLKLIRFLIIKMAIEIGVKIATIVVFMEKQKELISVNDWIGRINNSLIGFKHF